MVEENSVDISNILSWTALKELYAEQELCDVSIQVGDQLFRGHRFLLAAQSDYFRTLFRWHSQNVTDKSEPIVLRDIDAAAFGQVLQFMYTGHITLSASNLYALLCTSHYLALRYYFIEQACIKRVRKLIRDPAYESKLIPDELEMFAFVCVTRNELLIHHLSAHLGKNLGVAMREPNFTGILFEDLCVILERAKYYYCSDGAQSMMAAILLWVNNSRKDRTEYLDKLLEYVDFAKISSQDWKSLANEYKDLIEYVTLAKKDDNEYVAGSKYATFLYNTSQKFQNWPIATMNRELYFHVCIENNSCQKRMGIFSTSKDTTDWYLTRDFYFHRVVSLLRITTLNETLYSLCLHFQEHLVFSSLKSVWSSPDSNNLKSPPFVSGLFDICCVQDDVYVYDGDFRTSHKSNTVNTFTDEQISRGIFVYKRELDQWFPVPQMKSRRYEAEMTSDANLLYIIGGDGYAKHGSGEAYDYRSGKWHIVPRAPTELISAACAHQGRIYSAVGSEEITNFSWSNIINLIVYDPVAGRWMELSKSNLCIGCYNSIRLRSYKNELRITFSDQFYDDPEKCTVVGAFNELGFFKNCGSSVLKSIIKKWDKIMVENSTRIIECFAF